MDDSCSARILARVDGRIPGFANLDILKQVVRVGFSLLETIRMATLDGATFLRIHGRTGSIAAGKQADLLVVRGAPDQNIDGIDNVEIVFSNGIAYEPQTLLASVKGQVGSRERVSWSSRRADRQPS